MIDPAERARYMADGRAAFNRGDYYDAHEHWEAVWDDADEPERQWLQGMIQIATGLHKLSQRNSEVARRLITSGLGKLAGAPARIDGIDVAGMRGAAERVVQALTAHLPPPALPAI